MIAIASHTANVSADQGFEEGIDFFAVSGLILLGIIVFHIRWPTRPLSKGICFLLYLGIFLFDLIAFANLGWLHIGRWISPADPFNGMTYSMLFHFSLMQLLSCGLAIFVSGKLVKDNEV